MKKGEKISRELGRTEAFFFLLTFAEADPMATKDLYPGEIFADASRRDAG